MIADQTSVQTLSRSANGYTLHFSSSRSLIWGEFGMSQELAA